MTPPDAPMTPEQIAAIRAECGFDEPHEPHEYVVARDGKPVDMPCPGLPFDGLRQALATAIEGGYSDESIDIARYTGDPIYHAVVWEIRKHRANLDGPKTLGQHR